MVPRSLENASFEEVAFLLWDGKLPNKTELAQLKRDIAIYPQTLTPEQQQRLNEIEQELLTMAHEAEEETRNKTVLKGNGAMGAKQRIE